MARLTDSEITEMISQLPDWSVLEEDGMKRLNREFSFGDFASALEFTNRVGDLAEESNHHPRLVTEWAGLRLPGGAMMKGEWWLPISIWRKKSMPFVVRRIPLAGQS